MASAETIKEGVEFWRLTTVRKKVGLSKTEIYRRIKAGSFPRQRRYRDSTLTYWLSTEIDTWQRVELFGDDAVGLLG